MALGDLFKLAKLTVMGFSDEGRTQSLGEPFVAQYNPETLSLRHESVFGQRGIGGTAGGGGWSHSPPQRLSVNLIVDGTGVDVMGVQLIDVPTVSARISQFLDVAYNVQGSTHEPPYLIVQWGAGIPELGGFPCRLESVDINYKAFDRDGSPLHAELAAVFVRILSIPREDKQIKRSSPDLTHRRVVIEGDTLPLLCKQIYGSAEHYLRVAEVNRLEDFRRLVAGQELYFPPFERPQKK